MTDFTAANSAHIFNLELPAYHRPASISDDYKRGICNALSIMGHLKNPEQFNVIVMFKEGRVEIDCQHYEQDLRRNP